MIKIQDFKWDFEYWRGPLKKILSEWWLLLWPRNGNNLYMYLKFHSFSIILMSVSVNHDGQMKKNFLTLRYIFNCQSQKILFPKYIFCLVILNTEQIRILLKCQLKQNSYSNLRLKWALFSEYGFNTVWEWQRRYGDVFSHPLGTNFANFQQNISSYMSCAVSNKNYKCYCKVE